MEPKEFGSFLTEARRHREIEAWRYGEKRHGDTGEFRWILLRVLLGKPVPMGFRRPCMMQIARVVFVPFVLSVPFGPFRSLLSLCFVHRRGPMTDDHMTGSGAFSLGVTGQGGLSNPHSDSTPNSFYFPQFPIWCPYSFPDPHETNYSYPDLHPRLGLDVCVRPRCGSNARSLPVV